MLPIRRVTAGSGALVAAFVVSAACGGGTSDAPPTSAPDAGTAEEAGVDVVVTPPGNTDPPADAASDGNTRSQVATPTTPTGTCCDFYDPTTIELATATPGAAIYYTLDRMGPTDPTTLYTAPIVLHHTTTVTAFATKAGLNPSSIAQLTWTFEPVPPASAKAPTFAPPAGTYQGPQTVVLSSATPDATVFFTTDGSNPTITSSVYTQPLTIATTTTVRAIGASIGFANSNVASATYTITP